MRRMGWRRLRLRVGWVEGLGLLGRVRFGIVIVLEERTGGIKMGDESIHKVGNDEYPRNTASYMKIRV